MKKTQKPQCEFVAKGGHPCDVTFPRPNQLCRACRPFWTGRRRPIKPAK